MTYECKFENDITKIELPPGVKLDKDTLDALHAVMEEASGCWTRGPLSLCWSMNGQTISVSIAVFGITVGKLSLNPSNPCGRISLNLFLVSGYIELCFKDSCLILNGEICKFGSCSNFTNLRVVCF